MSVEYNKIRKDIALKLNSNVHNPRYNSPSTVKRTYTKVDDILSIKLRDKTLKEWIELYEQGKLVELADDQSLPDKPEEWEQENLDYQVGYLFGQDSLKKANFKKVK